MVALGLQDSMVYYYVHRVEGQPVLYSRQQHGQRIVLIAIAVLMQWFVVINYLIM